MVPCGSCNVPSTDLLSYQIWYDNLTQLRGKYLRAILMPALDTQLNPVENTIK